MSQRKVTLLLPGYTANRSPFADQMQAGEVAENDHQAPANFQFSEDLERQPWQAQMAQILGLDTAGGKRLPGARLGLLGEGAEPLSQGLTANSGLVRADPIFLKADRDSATLVPAEQLALSEEDSATLIKSMNDFVAEDGLSFFSRSPDEWYMSGRSAAALESYPPSFLASRKASTFLPDGDDAAPWRRLMTELQMLLHSHPINVQREQRGLMPVNSVWFWGGAALPTVIVEGTDFVFYADDESVRSLARHIGITCLPLVQFYTDVEHEFAAKDIVVVDLSVIQAWLNADAHQLDCELARIHEKWFHPLSRQVGEKQLERVSVMTEDGLQGLCDEHTQPPASPNMLAGWVKRVRDLINL